MFSISNLLFYAIFPFTEEGLDWYSLSYEFDFNATHPFYYAIVSNKTNSLQPIFKGRYVNPPVNIPTTDSQIVQSPNELAPSRSQAPDSVSFPYDTQTNNGQASQVPQATSDKVPSSSSSNPQVPQLATEVMPSSSSQAPSSPQDGIVTRTEAPEIVTQTTEMPQSHTHYSRISSRTIGISYGYSHVRHNLFIITY